MVFYNALLAVGSADPVFDAEFRAGPGESGFDGSPQVFPVVRVDRGHELVVRGDPGTEDRIGLRGSPDFVGQDVPLPVAEVGNSLCFLQAVLAPLHRLGDTLPCQRIDENRAQRLQALDQPG